MVSFYNNKSPKTIAKKQSYLRGTRSVMDGVWLEEMDPSQGSWTRFVADGSDMLMIVLVPQA